MLVNRIGYDVMLIKVASTGRMRWMQQRRITSNQYLNVYAMLRTTIVRRIVVLYIDSLIND